MAVGAIGGCSSPLQMPRSDAGRDTATSSDRPTKPTVDAGGKPDAHDGGIDRRTEPTVDASGELDAHDGGAVCPPLDLAGQCLSWNGCQPTWAGVLADPFCEEGLANFGDSEIRYDCGPYLVRSTDINVDAAQYTYYYDATTGMLAAIYAWSFVDRQVECIGGPPGGIAVSCETGQLICSGDGVLTDGGSPTDSSSPCEAGVCLDGGGRG